MSVTVHCKSHTDAYRNCLKDCRDAGRSKTASKTCKSYAIKLNDCREEWRKKHDSSSSNNNNNNKKDSSAATGKTRSTSTTDDPFSRKKDETFDGTRILPSKECRPLSCKVQACIKWRQGDQTKCQNEIEALDRCMRTTKGDVVAPTDGDKVWSDYQNDGKQNSYKITNVSRDSNVSGNLASWFSLLRDAYNDDDDDDDDDVIEQAAHNKPIKSPRSCDESKNWQKSFKGSIISDPTPPPPEFKEFTNLFDLESLLGTNSFSLLNNRSEEETESSMGNLSDIICQNISNKVDVDIKTIAVTVIEEIDVPPANTHPPTNGETDEEKATDEEAEESDDEQNEESEKEEESETETKEEQHTIKTMSF